MAVRNVVILGNATLRKKSKPVVAFDETLANLFDDMKSTLVEKKGMGISAVQVGVLRRAMIVEVSPKEFVEFVNPTLLKKRGKVTDSEGCLSVPGFFCDVTRPKYVKISAFDRNGNPFEFEAEGYTARCICHEMDHMDGVLFVDLTDDGKKYKKEKGVE